MSTFGSRLRKLDDRFGLGNETIPQLHLRALREAEQRRKIEAGESVAPGPVEDGPPVEAWRLMLLNPRR